MWNRQDGNPIHLIKIVCNNVEKTNMTDFVNQYNYSLVDFIQEGGRLLGLLIDRRKIDGNSRNLFEHKWGAKTSSNVNHQIICLRLVRVRSSLEAVAAPTLQFHSVVPTVGRRSNWRDQFVWCLDAKHKVILGSCLDSLVKESCMEEFSRIPEAFLNHVERGWYFPEIMVRNYEYLYRGADILKENDTIEGRFSHSYSQKWTS